MLSRQINDALIAARVLVNSIKDEAGLRLFLEIDRKVGDCMKELGIELVRGYVAFDQPEFIMDQVSLRVHFVLTSSYELLRYDPARAEKLLADLAAHASEIHARLYHLYDWEWSGDEVWGN
jgi:hypothetical protein